ncbi:hypothetical protein GCM10009000_035650 [Halobacterium noricense]
MEAAPAPRTVTLLETSSYTNFVLCYTLLRPIELEVLATVVRGNTISVLATKLDHSESCLSRAVADLVEKGLVYTERDGRRKRVVTSDARAVERYQDLVRQHSDIHFPKLLTGKALEVLYYLDQPRPVFRDRRPERQLP